MATCPLLMRFPQPIGRGMSFRIYRLAEKRHKVRDRKRAFAQTITTPGDGIGEAGQGEASRPSTWKAAVLRTDNRKEQRPRIRTRDAGDLIGSAGIRAGPPFRRVSTF